MKLRDVIVSPWVNVAAALVGGILLGFGIGRLANAPSVAAGITTVFGLIILWWANNSRRQMKPRNPESEADGSRTIE